MKKPHDFSIQPLAAMLIIATVAIALAAKAVTAPAIIALTAAVYALSGFPKLRRPRTYHALIIAVPFALWWREYGDQSANNNRVPVGFLFIVGLYMCALGVQHLLSHRRGGNLDYALACSIMGMALAGTVEIKTDEASNIAWFAPMLAAFIVLLMIHLRSATVGGHQKLGALSPSLRHAVAIGLLIVVTALVQVHVVRKLPRLNQWAVQQLISNASRPSVGFSRSAELGSVPALWNKSADNRVVLRVFAERSPEYLRGAAYDLYRPGTTHSRSQWTIIEEDRALDSTGTHWNRKVFDALVSEDPEGEDPPEQLGIVYPTPDFSANFFVPQHTHRVAAHVEDARFGRAYTMRPNNDEVAMGGYAYFAPTLPIPPPNERDSHVPDVMRWRLMRIAQRIVGEEQDPLKTIDKIVAHFEHRYDYGMGIEIPDGAEPMLYFLTAPEEQLKHAHCEFFAASATLLLRARGIPARYVTGFACREPADEDNVWLVRQKDAHAWVEAYLPDEGWVTVEPTPAGAYPDSPRSDGWDATEDWWSAWWHRVSRMLWHGGFTAAIAATLDFIGSIPQRMPVWGWVVLIALGVAWTFRKDLRRLLGRSDDRDAPEHIRRLRKQLVKAERLLAKHGLHRPKSQTVGEFLKRLNTSPAVPHDARTKAAALLSDYQRARFRPADP